MITVDKSYFNLKYKNKKNLNFDVFSKKTRGGLIFR